MNTAIWIIIALVAAGIGYFAADYLGKKKAGSRARAIVDEAEREAEVIKEKRILKAKEEEMKRFCKAQVSPGQAPGTRVLKGSVI